MNPKNPLLLSLCASITLCAASTRAAVYTEPGDAGQTLATAANSGLTTGTSVSTITGNLGSSTDADLYILTISNTTTFSATALGGTSPLGGLIDTSLFLFDSSGVPVYANDDQSNSNFQASLPAGNTLLTTLTPGTYYLGISLSGNEPVNSSDQNLFTIDQPTTNVRGIASGLNPLTEATFNGATYVAETGSYTITFAVPEPSSVVSMILGTSVVGGVIIRRKNRLAA